MSDDSTRDRQESPRHRRGSPRSRGWHRTAGAGTPRPGHPTRIGRSSRLVAGALVALALVAAVLYVAACGGSDSGSGDSGGGTTSDDRFAGAWAPVDARLEIAWSDSEKWYGISLAGDGESYGGLLVDKDGDAYTVTMVGLGGTRTDAFAAKVNGDALTFEMPIMDTPTVMTLTLTGEDAADVSFGEGASPWAFTKVDELVEETPAP